MSGASRVDTRVIRPGRTGVEARSRAGRWGTDMGLSLIIIGIDPHKGSHTAVALGELKVTADRRQRDRLLAWAASLKHLAQISALHRRSKNRLKSVGCFP